MSLRTIIIIAILIIGTVVGIYYWGKSEGNPSDEPLPDRYDSKSGGKIILTDQEQATVNRVAKALFDQMDGLNIFQDMSVYREMAELNDTLFVATYNRFNELYYDESEETLREFLLDEFNLGPLRTTIINRIDSLLA